MLMSLSMEGEEVLALSELLGAVFEESLSTVLWGLSACMSCLSSLPLCGFSFLHGSRGHQHLMSLLSFFHFCVLNCNFFLGYRGSYVKHQ